MSRERKVTRTIKITDCTVTVVDACSRTFFEKSFILPYETHDKKHILEAYNAQSSDPYFALTVERFDNRICKCELNESAFIEHAYESICGRPTAKNSITREITTYRCKVLFVNIETATTEIDEFDVPEGIAPKDRISYINDHHMRSKVIAVSIQDINEISKYYFMSLSKFMSLCSEQGKAELQ